MHVVQVNCAIDAEGRGPEELLQAWPTVSLVAEAVAQANQGTQAARAAGDTMDKVVQVVGDVALNAKAAQRVEGGAVLSEDKDD